jgi:hypothetical protein
MKEETDEVLSLLDLISYYESGPVLKERTPDIVRTPSHPEELVYCNKKPPPSEGKSLTKRVRLANLHKEALGFFDVPGGSPDGAQGYRPRSAYEEQDFEASHRSGFGGPSVIDVQEDKAPSNIRRREYNKPINNRNKTESKDYFSFLETGRLRRKRISGVTRAMNTEQRELSKLAKALNMSGYTPQADVIRKMAQEGYFESAVAGGIYGGTAGALVGGAAGAGVFSWLTAPIGLQLGAAIGVAMGIYDVYNDTETNRAIAAALGAKAQTVVEAIMKLGSVWGGNVNAETLQNALGADGRTVPDFQGLYGEILKTWSEQDFQADMHIGSLGDDQGDMGYIDNFATTMRGHMEKEISYDDVKEAISAHPDFNRFGGDASLDYASGEMAKYIAAWNAVVAFQKEANQPAPSPSPVPSPSPSPGPSPSPSGRIWGPVQTRLNELDQKDEHGRVLTTEGIWGPNTQHAWDNATNNADKPSTVEAALAALSGATTAPEEPGAQTLSKEKVMIWLKYDGEGLELPNRDARVAQLGAPAGPADEDDAKQLTEEGNMPDTVTAYNNDLEANPNMELVIGRWARLNRDGGTTDDTTEVNLEDYFHHPDSNIYMKKSDGSIHYLEGEAVEPIANRGTQGHDEGQNRMTFKEGRQMRRVLREAVDSQEITEEQKRSYINMIRGTRRADTDGRYRDRRRQSGRDMIEQSQQALTGAGTQ